MPLVPPSLAQGVRVGHDIDRCIMLVHDSVLDSACIHNQDKA